MITDLLRGQWSSASNALADRLCRGRYQAQIHLPELPRSEASEAGTVIHALWTGTEPPRQATADEQEKAEALREQEAKVAEEFFSPEAELVRIVERRLWHEFPAVSDDPEAWAQDLRPVRRGAGSPRVPPRAHLRRQVGLAPSDS